MEVMAKWELSASMVLKEKEVQRKVLNHITNIVLLDFTHFSVPFNALS